MDRLRRLARELRHDQGGVVAVIVGLSLSVLIGCAALAVEGSKWYSQYRQVRSAVDTAAFSAATAYAAGDTSGYANDATAIAALYGYVNGTNSVAVTVNRPPKSGSYTANNAAIEVIITAPQAPMLSALFLHSNVNLNARAVAVGKSAAICGLALASTSTTAVSISGGANVTLNQCGLDVNAAGSSAVLVTGGASLNVTSMAVVGNYSVTPGASINASGGITTGAAATADPYAGLLVPGYSGCGGGTGLSLGHSASTQHLSPGVYCNGLSMSSDAVVVMNPGVYIIDRGSFSVSGAANVSGTGVTIVLTSSTGSGYASVSISGGAVLALTAPTSGAMSGVVFYGDRHATSGSISFSGGSKETIIGAVYAPNYSISFSGGATGTSPCTQLLAHDLQFSGGVTLNNNCVGVGTSAIGGSGSTQLLE